MSHLPDFLERLNSATTLREKYRILREVDHETLTREERELLSSIYREFVETYGEEEPEDNEPPL